MSAIAWRQLSPEEADFLDATDAFVNDTEPGDLFPHEIAAFEEFFGVGPLNPVFDHNWSRLDLA